MGRKRFLGFLHRLVLTVILASLLILPIPVSVSGDCEPPDSPFTFPDPNLNALLTGSPNGYTCRSGLAYRALIQGHDLNISDLTGLEYCTNLNVLSFRNNQITDLSPLSGLTNLTYLDLCGNKISDISPLSGLTNLEQLDLSNNQISDISPLSGLTNLKILYLSNNQISHLAPLLNIRRYPGCSEGATFLGVTPNPLSCDSIVGYIPQLRGGWNVVDYTEDQWGSRDQAPLEPTIVSPAIGATGVSVTPTLQAGPFEDPDPEDTQCAAVWMINDPGPLFNSGPDTSNLTSITVPQGVLTGNTEYYWYVGYADNHGKMTSSMGYFHTAPVLGASLTGYVEDCRSHRLGGVKVELVDLATGKAITEGITDDNGTYYFADIAPGYYQAKVTLECYETLRSSATFSIYYEPGKNGPVIVSASETDSFKVEAGGNTHNISFFDKKDWTPAEDMRENDVIDLAAMYYPVKQVIDFEETQLGVPPDLDLPIEVHAYVPDNKSTENKDESKTAWYVGGDIYIGSGLSDYDASDAEIPMNREWHEMFHELMEDATAWPPHAGGVYNHKGFGNPDTQDSWAEGWAEFWSCALNRYLEKPAWFIYAGYWNFELNFPVWNFPSGESREEFAVASLLVDLVDGVSELDDDFISLTIEELWAIIGSQKLLNMREVYRALVDSDLGLNLNDTDNDGIHDLDELFAVRGFHSDNNTNQHYDAGEEIGWGGKPTRENTPLIPNAYLRATLTNASGNPVDGTLIVNVVFPSPLDFYNYSYEVDLHGSDGLVYLEVAPTDVEASIHVHARGSNGILSDECVISNTAYWKEVEKSTTGYAVEQMFILPVETASTASPWVKWGIIGGIIGAVVAVAGAGVWLVVGRRPRKAIGNN